MEEHLGLGDHVAPVGQDLGDRDRGRPVQHDAEGAVLVDVEEQDHRVGEVRVEQGRRGHEEHPRPQLGHVPIIAHGGLARAASRGRAKLPA